MDSSLQEPKAEATIPRHGIKQTKFVNVWIVQGNYGYGWDDLCAGDSWREIRQDLKDYRDNEPYPHRAIRRRIKRENYETGNY